MNKKIILCLLLCAPALFAQGYTKNTEVSILETKYILLREAVNSHLTDLADLFKSRTVNLLSEDASFYLNNIYHL